MVTRPLFDQAGSSRETLNQAAKELSPKPPNTKIILPKERLIEAVFKASKDGGVFVEIEGITFAVAVSAEAIEELESALGWPTIHL